MLLFFLLCCVCFRRCCFVFFFGLRIWVNESKPVTCPLCFYSILVCGPLCRLLFFLILPMLNPAVLPEASVHGRPKKRNGENKNKVGLLGKHRSEKMKETCIRLIALREACLRFPPRQMKSPKTRLSPKRRNTRFTRRLVGADAQVPRGISG